MNIVAQHAHMLEQLTGQDYFEFGFNRTYFEKLAKLLDAPTDVSLDQFELDHFEIVSAYFQYTKFDDGWVTIEDENKAIQEAQNHITALIPSLNELTFNDNIRERSYEELKAGIGSVFELNGIRLSDFAGDEDALIFEPVTSLLRDLLLALEHSKIRTFKTAPKIESTLKIKLTASSPQEYLQRDVASAALASQDEDHDTRRRRLTQKYGKPREMPLLGFLDEFSVLWHKYSPHKFSEGRYESSAGQYISRTVDAAQFCLEQLQVKYPYNTVAKKVRIVRESADC